MKISVLAVDDEKVFLDFISQMELWKKETFKFAGTARSAEEALRYLSREKVDVVLLDVSMPGMDGVELSAIISQTYSEIEMIALSGYDNYDYVRKILKNGAHDYILKSRFSEELLEELLEQILERKKNCSTWDTKKGLRDRVKKWLLENRENPFTQDNSRKAAVIGRIYFSDKDTEKEREVLREGIARLFEEEAEAKQDILAFFADEVQFVLIYRFYEEHSENSILSKLEKNRLSAEKNIERIFGVRAESEKCPLFFSDAALRSFLLHKLKSTNEKTTVQKDRLTMTLEQQNMLLSAVKRLNYEKAEQMVRTIYAQIPMEKEAMCMMITRELLELLDRICLEYEIKLDFIPKDFRLFSYTQRKSRETLSDNISGLYFNILREIKEKEQKKGQFSEMVSCAILYMKEHCSETITLSQTAERLNVNSSYLSRVFHGETGMTFIEYLNRIRVEKAKELLKDGKTLKETVGACGFQSYNYFLKIFKEYTGQTPKKYLLHE